eukprot:m.48268 g.48268  ORF g.48268 m.48268 type:complete len:471 (-) comp11024_c0_seq1:1482-2894(-)
MVGFALWLLNGVVLPLSLIFVLVCIFGALRSRLASKTVPCVLVLGDLGRSPRMQYHVLSLVNMFGAVSVVAYSGSKPVADIVCNKHINFVPLTEPPRLAPGLPRALFLLYAPLKAAFQAVQLLVVLLFKVPAPSHLLVQNPPSIPAFPIAALVAALTGTVWIIDWHNYGYSILALKAGNSSPLVRVSKWIEATFGRLGSKHLCVTDAMSQDLAQNWGICDAVPLHDRPPKYFAPISLAETHDLMLRLEQEYSDKLQAFRTFFSVQQNETLLTTQAANGIEAREKRPALLVSGTSWTPDEDFGLLLDALRRYESEYTEQLPKLLVFITGKGPLKAFYEQEIARAGFHHVCVITAWLAIEDYPRLLASCDLGVSLHTSSSGLDLPMKVVDMFGCGLPACALSFKCIGELVQDGVNGCLFNTADELCDQLKKIFSGFPKCKQLDVMSQGALAFRRHGWDENWQSKAQPLFLSK